MKRCYYMILMLMLIMISSSSSAQIFSRPQADSVSAILKHSTCDSCRVIGLLNLADFLLHERHVMKSQLDSARADMIEARQVNHLANIHDFEQRIQLLQALFLKTADKKQDGQAMLSRLATTLELQNNQLLLGKTYYELSDFFSGNFLQPIMSKRIYYLEKSIKAYEKAKDKFNVARDYRFLADLHLMSNSPVQAFVEANKSLTLYHAVGYKDIQGVLALLGRLYFGQGNYREAINYELVALNAAMKSKQDNVRLICQINNNLGTTFFTLNDFPNALHHYGAALNIAEQEKDNATIYMMAAKIVDCYLKAGRGQQAVSFFQKVTHLYAIPEKQIYESGDCGISKTFLKIYTVLGRFDKARPYYENLVKATANPNINFYSLSEYYDIIARTNIRLHNFPLAGFYLDKNEKLLFSIKDYTDLSANYRLKASLDTAQGNFRSGMRHVLSAQRIEDSLFNAVKASQIEQLQVAYKTSEKESQISLLQQKASVERIKLQKSNIMRNFSLGGTIMLFIIAILLYRQNQQKRQNNKLILQNNKQLASLVTEKEWLLKEVHHRVKNNLHTVICLLESQASFLEDEALHALESSRCRIYAMSLIHQKFYQSDNIRSIEIRGYISELVYYLRQSFGLPDHIHTYIDIPEIYLSISKAIPVGLIINEAVNNAYKYAFPNYREGEIFIRLKVQDTTIRLEIRDNGVGIPFDPISSISDSLGIELMKGLTTDLKGTITFLQGAGTGIIVTFQFDPVPDGLKEVFYV